MSLILGDDDLTREQRAAADQQWRQILIYAEHAKTGADLPPKARTPAQVRRYCAKRLREIASAITGAPE